MIHWIALHYIEMSEMNEVSSLHVHVHVMFNWIEFGVGVSESWDERKNWASKRHKVEQMLMVNGKCC